MVGPLHPNRAKDSPERVRRPKLIAVVGWLFGAVGLLMGLVDFTSIDGARLSLNIQTFDGAPLLQAIRIRETKGRWPGRGELVRWARPGPPPSAAPPR